MNLHRYGRDRPRQVRATAGDVFVALSRDAWAREKLGEVYRRLFEGEGLRQGTSPDHFIYVAPGRARAEINELAAWVGERFGDPAGTVPARTPFGYLSSRYDGWITLFAAIVHGTDRGVAVDFAESVAGMTWSTPITSRARAAGSGASEEVQVGGTIATLWATSEAGVAWVEANVPLEPWQGNARDGFFCEPRMAPAIIGGMRDDGLSVEEV